MRLQKGNPDRALSCEALALRELGARGLPVPDLVVEGPGFLVIADCGPSLNLMVRDVGIPSAEKLRAMTAAGAALARLHYAGVVHGRPSIRDFCWDGDQITLIDWERYRPHANTRFRMRVDAVIFVFNLYALLRGNTPELIVAIDAYRAKAPPGLWDEAARLCRRLAIFDLLTKRQQRRDAGRGEFRAIPLTLRRFRAP
jgi:tRNA A-37 threonylcarbamoyl transferase component Bud32